MERKWRNFKRRWRRRWRRFKKNHPLPAWSKILMVIMILLCGEIITYAEVAMWKTWDMSCLYALVGVAASLAASIWAYCEKAKAENTAGGITYETAMKEEKAAGTEAPPNEDGTYG